MNLTIVANTPTFRQRRNRDGGITLIEMLVVLAVIGVATGATMLGLNSADRDSRAESEAVRLARNLSLGVDEALVGGSPLALIWDAGLQLCRVVGYYRKLGCGSPKKFGPATRLARTIAAWR